MLPHAFSGLLCLKTTLSCTTLEVNNNLFYLHAQNLKPYVQCIIHLGVRLWNELQDELKCLPSLNAFKNTLKSSVRLKNLPEGHAVHLGIHLFSIPSLYYTVTCSYRMLVLRSPGPRNSDGCFIMFYARLLWYNIHERINDYYMPDK